MVSIFLQVKARSEVLSNLPPRDRRRGLHKGVWKLITRFKIDMQKFKELRLEHRPDFYWREWLFRELEKKDELDLLGGKFKFYALVGNPRGTICPFCEYVTKGQYNAYKDQKARGLI